MPEPTHTETPPNKRRTVDIGIATLYLAGAGVVAALIAAVAAIVVAILSSRHGGPVTVVMPTVTVTASAHPGVAITPHPTVTVTKLVTPRVVRTVRKAGGWTSWLVVAIIAGLSALGATGAAAFAQRRLTRIRVHGFQLNLEPSAEAVKAPNQQAEGSERTSD